LELIG